MWNIEQIDLELLSASLTIIANEKQTPNHAAAKQEKHPPRSASATHIYLQKGFSTLCCLILQMSGTGYASHHQGYAADSRVGGGMDNGMRLSNLDSLDDYPPPPAWGECMWLKGWM